MGRGKPSTSFPRSATTNPVVALCKEDRIDEALDAFKRQPDPFGASSLIATMGKQRHGLDRAFDVFNMLIAAGHRPNTVVVGALVNACRQCGHPERALHLLDDIDRFNIRWSEMLFHLLAAACGEARDAVAARKLLAMMRSGSMGFKADTVDCGQLVKALVSSSNPDTDTATLHLDNALSVLDLMDEQGIPPTSQLFATLLSACSDNGQLDQGKRIHARILNSKVHINRFVASSLISMYSKCGSLDDAVAVFADMCRRGGPELDVGVWTAMMAAFGQHGDALKALETYQQMLSAGHRPNTVVVNALVNACRQCGHPGRALHLLADIDRFNVKWDEMLLHMLAAACGEAGDAVAAKKLLAMMRGGGMGFKANTVDCGQLVKALVSNSNPDTDAATLHLNNALSVLDLMNEQGIPPTSQLFSMLLPTCSDNGQLDQGKRIHARILNSKVHIDRFVASSLISMYSKCGSLDDAVAVFADMCRRGGPELDVGVWTAMMAAFGQHGDALKALETYQQMLSAGHRPNAVVVNALVSACRQCGHPGRALHLLADIDRFGIKWDEMLLHMLAAACGEAGDAVAAKKLLAMMRGGGMGFKANTVDCGQLVKALVSNSNPDTDTATLNLNNALSVLDLMNEQGIPPTSQLFATLLPTCSDNGQLDQGKRIHARILNSKVHIDRFVASSLISMYSKCGSLDDAVAVFADMRRHGGPELDVGVWTAMLAAFGQHGRSKEALALFEEMVHEGNVMPNDVTFVAVLNACSHSDMADESLRIFHSMESRFGIHQRSNTKPAWWMPWAERGALPRLNSSSRPTSHTRTK